MVADRNVKRNPNMATTIKVGDVTITATIAGGTFPRLVISGIPETSQREQRVRVQVALLECGVEITRDVLVAYAPEIPRGAARYDAAVAVAVACALGDLPAPNATPIAELGLSGQLRPVAGSARIALVTPGAIVVHEANAPLVQLVAGVRTHTAAHLRDVLDGAIDAPRPVEPTPEPDLPPLHGAPAKLALRVADALAHGARKILIVGPPGAAVTMVARRAVAFLPTLTGLELEQVLAYDDAGLPAATARPFRAPHHTASVQALRGEKGRPGEIQLAANGVLFLDEVTEFRLDCLEIALRAPGVVIASARPEELARARTRARRDAMARFDVVIAVDETRERVSSDTNPSTVD